MSRVLPAELQTKKVKSLSGDQKKLVEDLLAEKFDIKEEVVKKKATPFQERGGWDPRFVDGIGPQFQDGPRMDGSVGRGVGFRVKVQPWNGHRVAEIDVDYPDSHHLERALIELDRRVGHPMERKIYMGSRFIREMMRDTSFARAVRVRQDFYPEPGVDKHIGEIFGFPIIEIMGRECENRCIIEQRY